MALRSVLLKQPTRETVAAVAPRAARQTGLIGPPEVWGGLECSAQAVRAWTGISSPRSDIAADRRDDRFHWGAVA